MSVHTEPRAGAEFQTGESSRRAPGGGGRPVRVSTRPGIVDDHLVSVVAPGSLEAEQYRVLRHQMEQLQKAGGLKVVAVTSPGVGDGKSTTAINLAASMAQAPGTRVLLVDADLRRPSVGPRLGLESTGPGFVGAILEPGFELEVLARHASNLSVLPAGRSDGLHYELLRSPRAGEVLSEARAAYDFVVVDTPPVLLVPDCHALSHWVDGFLLVVAAHRTPRGLVAEALNLMDPGKVMGIVFNDDDRPLSGYYKRYYGYGPERGRSHADRDADRGAARKPGRLPWR